MGKKMSTEYRVTVLSDKYDLTRMLRPWATSWLSDIAGEDRKNFTSRVWIAWELGDYELFATECDNLYHNTSIDSDGNLLDTAGARLDTCPMLENLDILGEYSLGPAAFRSTSFWTCYIMALVDADYIF
jgi:hypothetical protein